MKETPAFRRVTGDCPSHDVWGLVCIGGLPEGQADRYLSHAATCPVCSVFLRQASEVLTEAEKPEEGSVLSGAGSSTPLWQEQMAHRLAASVRADLNHKEQSPFRLNWKLWFPRLSWQMVGCALVLVSGVSMWFWYSTRHAADHLIAQAYDEDRTLELRIPGARFSPLQQAKVMRGSGSAGDQPASLLEARGMIARQLEHDPQDPKWLELDARAHLLDGNLDRTLETTNHLLLLNPTDHDLLLDGAIAYFQRGKLSENPQDIGTAIDLLGRLLARSPRDSVALYNQAIAFEHLYQYENAVRTWNTFLSVEKDPGWLADGRRHLQDIEEKQKARQGVSEEAPLSGAQIFALATDKADISAQDEELSTVQLPGLLKAAYPEGNPDCNDPCLSARLVLGKLSVSLKKKHNDPWLADLLLFQSSENWTKAVHALSDAILADAKGIPSDGLNLANVAIALFHAEGNPVGEARARVEQVYAYQRLLNGRSCLQASEELDKQLKNAAYYWIQGQFALDHASCYAAQERFDEEKNLLEQAASLAESGHYRILALRALGIRTAFDFNVGDYESSWKEAVAGLREYWSGRYPVVRAYQFYNTLANVEALRSRAYLFLYLNQEVVAAAPKLNMEAIEGFARFRLVQALIRSGDEWQAEKELERAEAQFAHLPDPDRFRSYVAESLINLANLKIERHEIDAANHLLNRAEGQLVGENNQHLKFSLAAIRGSMLMESGQWPQALATLTSAAQWTNSEAKHLDSTDERMSWLRLTEPIYAGLALSNFEVNHSAEQSLTLWERYRGELLGSDYAVHCLQTTPDCVNQAIQREKSRLRKGALIGNIVLDQGVLAWRMDREGVSLHFVPIERHDLMQKVEIFTQLAQMPQGREEDLKRYGRDLFSILVEPVWRGYDAGQVVYLEPDAALARLPFAALPFLDSYWGLVSPLANVVSILEDDSDVTTVSKTLASVSGGRPLIIGNPKLPEALAPPLPDASEEARFISNMLPHATLLVGDAAQKEAVLQALPTATVFHFAGHTQSWSSHTRLLLASASTKVDIGGTYSSSLRSSDIVQNRPKKCRLAVLSACATGNRDSLDADVVSDMVSSFAQVGVPEIIATHWSVDSASSSILMQSFYSELMMGIPVPIALQKAQAKLASAGYIHPRYWASFYAVGFGRTNFTEKRDVH